jgi:hypothetical protein
MRVLPAIRMSKAMSAVADDNEMIEAGPRTPMPVEISEPVPACKNPSRAEALPASREKGASPMAAAFG